MNNPLGLAFAFDNQCARVVYVGFHRSLGWGDIFRF